ncbi:MAG: FtsQ-type POTRA domain-containing protein [Thermoleophilia bacterium]
MTGGTHTTRRTAGARPARPVRPHPAIARRRRAVRGLPGRRELLALAAAGLACGVAGYRLDNGPVLAVDGVRVSGYDRPDKAALEAAVARSADRGGSLLAPPVGAIRRTAVTFPWVEDVYVARDWPVGLVVQVTQARPIAIGVPARGGRVLISSRGLVMGPAKGVGGLPRIIVPGTAPEAGSRIPAGARAALQLVKFSTPETAARFRKLRIERGRLVGLLVNGPELRLGTPTQLRAKALAIEAVLTDASAEEERKATYLDVTVPDHPAMGGLVAYTEPVVTPAPAPAATPPAGTADPAAATPDPAAGTSGQTAPGTTGATGQTPSDATADPSAATGQGVTTDGAADPSLAEPPDPLIDPVTTTGVSASPSSGG